MKPDDGLRPRVARLRQLLRHGLSRRRTRRDAKPNGHRVGGTERHCELGCRRQSRTPYPAEFRAHEGRADDGGVLAHRMTAVEAVRGPLHTLRNRRSVRRDPFPMRGTPSNVSRSVGRGHGRAALRASPLDPTYGSRQSADRTVPAVVDVSSPSEVGHRRV